MVSRTLLIALFALIVSGCNKEKPGSVTAGKDNVAKPEAGTAPMLYKWNYEGCNYEGVYADGQYTSAQLDGTHYLCYRTAYLTDASLPAIPSQLYGFDPEKELAKLDEEYFQNKIYLEQLKLVPGAKWESLRQSRLRELKERYDFKLVAFQGIAAPETFLDNPFSGYCREYATALNAADADMLEVWRELIEKRAKSYGHESTERSYMNRYRGNRASPDSVAYAKIDIFHYGWYECAYRHVYHVDDEKGLEEDFKRLFSDVKKDCPPDNETDGI